jgi:hypothetical protein
MNTRLFRGALICLLFPVVGCAVSAVVDDQSLGLGSDETNDDDADDGSLDDLSDDESLSVQRDAGRVADAGRASAVDAGRTAGKDAAVAADASVVDAGRSPVVVDAGKPVVVDAGKPAVVDAGTPSLVDAGAPVVTPTPLPAGCTEKTLQTHRYAFCPSALSFSSARSACLKAGMDLVIVADRTESDFVATNGESWIGETYVSAKSAYLAVVPGNASRLDGAAVSYVNWAQGVASDIHRCGLLPIGCHVALSSETCIAIASGGKWDDASCTASKGYVCESY